MKIYLLTAFISMIFLVLGIVRGEVLSIFQQAIYLCLSCMGIS